MRRGSAAERLSVRGKVWESPTGRRLQRQSSSTQRRGAGDEEEMVCPVETESSEIRGKPKGDFSRAKQGGRRSEGGSGVKRGPQERRWRRVGQF